MLARHERRDERIARRQVERADRRADRREHVDRPDGSDAAERDESERDRHDRGGDLREEHQAAAIPGIGDHAAEHRERDDGHDAHETDEAERQRLALRCHEQRHVPQERGVLHHRSREGDEQTDPDQPVIAVLQRDERLAGDQGATSVPGS